MMYGIKLAVGDISFKFEYNILKQARDLKILELASVKKYIDLYVYTLAYIL